MKTIHKNYFLSTNIEYKGNLLNVFNFIETNNKKVTTFRYITNLEVKHSNIKELACLGRNRWKIENEGFYTQNIEQLI